MVQLHDIPGLSEEPFYVPNVGVESIVIFYDGQKSHVCGPLIHWANENKIMHVLYILPPHTSHLQQPLNVGIFGPLKKNFFFVHDPIKCCQWIKKIWDISL